MNNEKSPSSNVVTPNEEPVTKDTFDLMVASVVDESDPLLQLDNLHDMSELLKTTHLDDGEVKELLSALETTSFKDSNTPLVSLSLAYLKDCIATDYYHDRDAELKISKYFISDLQNQDQLHEDYPALPSNHIIVRLAPGIAYSLDDYHEMESTAFMGTDTTIPESEDSQVDPLLNLIKQDENTPLWILSFAHDVRFRGLIEDKLELDLSEIPLDSQVQLLKFMAKADTGRFDRLCETLHSIPDEKLRLEFAESFLANGFGEDFGDALLDIAGSKRLSGEQLGEILGQIESCRDSIRKITEMYEDYDGGKFANEYARAANERLTDAITVFQEIARDGTATANLDWAGTPRFTYSRAMEALQYEANSLAIISGTLGDVAGGKEGAFAELLLTPDQYHNRSMYSFYSPDHGYVLLYTRPEGSSKYDSSLEYGNRSGIEASISLITNPVNPHELPSPFKPNPTTVRNPRYYDPSTMDKVSAIRIDREGRTLDMAANDPRRSPVNADGIVSVDLAAIGDRADTPSGKIARLFSVGNAIRAARVGGEVKLNHNTNWFDQDKYGNEGGFRGLVYYVDGLAMAWCEKHPSNENQGFRAAARQARRSSRHKKPAA